MELQSWSGWGRAVSPVTVSGAWFSSESVKGSRLTKTRNPLTSSSADLPPMPDPSGATAATTSPSR